MKLIAKLPSCPQCGEEWPVGRHASEFCSRCGSPAGVQLGFDPFKRSLSSTIAPITRKTKLVIRSGVLGIGLVSLLSGSLMTYGGWVDPQQMDIVQVWISRIAGPGLLLFGGFYMWMPFRSPVQLAKILQFPSRAK